MNNNIIDLNLEPELDDCEQDDYEVFDSCYGIVLGRYKNGALIQLDNGREAFAFAGLIPGAKVLCTIRRKPRFETDKILVRIDSVMTHMPIKAA